MIGPLGDRLRSLSRRMVPRRRAARESSEKEVIQGRAGNVIIVKSPNTEYFKEAIFILCDDLFTRRGVNSRELLREAKQAADEYCAEHAPPREPTALWHVFYFLLGAASCLAALMLLKLF